jgi:hypothetical protein
MNRESGEMQRSTGDFVLFAVVFVGFVLGAIGLITTAIPTGVVGLILMGLGLCYFLVKED